MKTLQTLNIERHPANPILTPEPGSWWRGDQARNTAAWSDGEKVHLIFTAATREDLGRPIHLGHAVSDDGVNFTVDPEPWLSPSEDRDDFDFGTVEDARITEIDGEVYVTYAARWHTFTSPSVGWPDYPRTQGRKGLTWHDEHSRRTGLIRVTKKDFSEYEKLGPLTQDFVNDANTLLFPEKIGGKYALLHRPTPFRPHKWSCHYCPACIFIAFSETLMPWDWSDFDEDVLLIAPEQPWEGAKVGGSGPPIRTQEGWLAFYHAMDNTANMKNGIGAYRNGLVLLDLDDPTRVIARTPEPIFGPELPNEIEGRVPNVVFPCGNVIKDDTVYIYYGACDQDTNLAMMKISDALDFMQTCRR
jgi:predicted GH43/DUF377 family glycosyl hydrolase